MTELTVKEAIQTIYARYIYLRLVLPILIILTFTTSGISAVAHHHGF